MENKFEKPSIDVHLVYDVYVEDTHQGVYLRGNKKRYALEQRTRNSSILHKNRTKIEITLFSLLSYSVIDWKSHNFRIFCENKNHYERIKNLIDKNFLDPNIKWCRSDTEAKFYDAISHFGFQENDLLYLAVNNDHPLIGDPNEFCNLICDVRDEFEADPDLYMPISHFYEAINGISPFHRLWLHYGGVRSKVLKTKKNYHKVQYNKIYFESFHIARVDRYKKVFQNRRTTRCIRPEDTLDYLRPVKSKAIIPRFEILRHYDGYFQYFDKIPLLGIPEEIIEANYEMNGLVITSYQAQVKKNMESMTGGSSTGANIYRDDVPFFIEQYAARILGINELEKNQANIEYKRLANLAFSTYRLIKYNLKNFWEMIK